MHFKVRSNNWCTGSDNGGFNGNRSSHIHPKKAFLAKYVGKKSIGHRTAEYRGYSSGYVDWPLSPTNAKNKNMHKINDAYLSALSGWRIIQDIVDDGWQAGFAEQGKSKARVLTAIKYH